MLTCRQLFERLSEFLDGELSEDACQRVRAHLGECAPCRTFFRTLEQTVRLCEQLPSAPLPDDVRRDLQERLRAEWRRRFARSEGSA
jgi:anti-sigma factor RsiW